MSGWRDACRIEQLTELTDLIRRPCLAGARQRRRLAVEVHQPLAVIAVVEI